MKRKSKENIGGNTRYSRMFSATEIPQRRHNGQNDRAYTIWQPVRAAMVGHGFGGSADMKIKNSLR